MKNNSLYNFTYDYVSWISNVSGRLFFHLTGDGHNYRYDRIVGDVFHFNEIVGDKRIFFLSMLVDLRDENKKNSSKYTRVIICSKIDNSICPPKHIQGNVYFIDDKKNSGLVKNDTDINFFNELNKIKNNNSTFKNYDENVSHYLNECSKESTFQRVNHINFRINDTGIIFLKKIDKLNSKDEIDSDVKAAFFLLKFTFHKDRYHDTAVENIIRIISYKRVKDCKQNYSNQTENEIIAKMLLGGE